MKEPVFKIVSADEFNAKLDQIQALDLKNPSANIWHYYDGHKLIGKSVIHSQGKVLESYYLVV